MINFDFLTLNAFLDENIDFFLGARLQKIQQPTRQELIFTMRNLGETRKFYINISPRFFHICFMSDENEKKRFLKMPKSPPMFCMLLRKYLESAKIAQVCQPKEERILEFYFETYNEIGEKIYLCLAIELMGKHSNLVLYNYDTNVIIGCAHNVGSDKSRERELIGGLPYIYPPKVNRKSFSGFSQLLSEKEPVNQTINDYFANLQSQDKLKSFKGRLLLIAKNKLKKVNSAMEKLQKQGVNAQKTDSYRKKGDLIMANLFQNKDFVNEIEVFDYETNSSLKIELDKTKTLKENANNFYKLYKKAKTALEKTQEMAHALGLEKDNLEQILYSIESAQNFEDLSEIEEEITPHPTLSRKGRGEKLVLLTIHHSPFTIYVGKNNRQNDYIVSKLARDEDLWFHTHNCAGSHVLLRVEAGYKPDDKIIYECAKLAKEHSSTKNSSKVGVIYTQAKNLKKPPAAPLGYVIYKGEKEIIVG